MNLETKDSALTLRCPKYIKEHINKKAKLAGLKTGELLRNIMFLDMLLDYSPEGMKKLSRLRKAYEVTGGMIPEALASEIMGGAYSPQDELIERVMDIGIDRITLDPVNTSVSSTIRSAIAEAKLNPAPNVSHEVSQDVTQDVSQKTTHENVSHNEIKDVIQSVKQEVKQEKIQNVSQDADEKVTKPVTRKPKRPKIGATNVMI